MIPSQIVYQMSSLFYTSNADMCLVDLATVDIRL